MFYKEINDSICLFIHVRQQIHSHISSSIDGYIGILPYCAKLDLVDLEPRDYGYNIITFYKRLLPEKFESENLQEFHTSRFQTNDEQSMLNSLNNICNDLEDFVLPYIHKFEDFTYLYDELIKLLEIAGAVDAYTDDYIYALSLKLHKYENAMRYVEYRLTRHSKLIKEWTASLEEVNKGNVAALLNDPLSDNKTPLTDEFVAMFFTPDVVKMYVEATMRGIAESQDEIFRYKTIKSALLSNDFNYLDNLVQETEENNRKNIRQMIMNTTHSKT